MPSSSLTFAGKLRDYKLLIKFNLSFMVVFSALICYLLAPKVTQFDWWAIILFFLGGMLVTGSANAINQIVERDTDAMMKRTANRPIASGRMSVEEGWIFAVIAGIGGVLILWHFNFLAAALSAFSLFVYAFIYTPLKKVTSISVLVGAIPGSLPCLIGWAAGNDDLSVGGWVLFALQFFWQFPHFWAIAWIAHKDYEKAGFRLLPSIEGPTRYSAIQAVIYSLLLLPVGVLPYYIGMSGQISLAVLIVANGLMVWQCVRLYREMTVQAARRVMFGSYIYLPVVLLALLANKTA
ncbi:MAG: heme o synthase [Bacteroidota bacterium]|nr:heme o synthase [Bacteroidota bacterium]MDP4258427.1 heme o synthase [Bacteroidota bacterium]